MSVPRGFREVGVLLDGKETDIRGLYHIKERTTMVSALDLTRLLGLPIEGLGDKINIGKSVVKDEEKNPLLGRRIAVSAPHTYNRNQSTIIPSYYEGNVMFDVAKELEHMLISDGAVVFMPRSELKEHITLSQRSARINSFNPDLCIETHTDASASPSARGMHVIRQIARTDEVLPRLILDELSNNLSIPVRSKAIWTRVLDNNPRFDWYHFLREVRCEALIIECGFHTNADDMEILNSPSFPRLYAKSIRDAIVRYYS